MKIFKKLILGVLLFIPISINAKAVENVDYVIDSMYINASVDILGSVHVQEAIVINGAINGFERTINFKNPNLKEWDGGEIDFSNSSIYNARAIGLSKVSSFKVKKDDISWEILDTKYTEYENNEDAQIGDSGVYTLKETENGKIVRVYNPNESDYIVYYFDYYIDQAVILHNDVAELYWTFIPQDFDYVKEAHIQLTIPGSCTDETFRFWAHGPLNGEIGGVSEDKDDDGNNLYRGIVADVYDIAEGVGTDIRITFDKSMMSAVQEYLTSSGVDALDAIIEVETGRANDANKQRAVAKTIYYGIYILSGIYLVGLIVLWIYMYKKYDKEYKVNFDAKYYREFTGDYEVEVVDYLLNQNISTNAMSASIMNLIYKKNIEVINDAKDKKNPVLKLVSRENLTSCEEKLVDLLFKTVTTSGQLSMKELEKFSTKYSTAQKFMNGYNSWKDEVETVALNENFFEDYGVKRATAAMYILFGIVVAILMFVLDMILPLVLLVMIVLSVIFLIYVFSFKKWTKKGREHYLKWNAFKNFLKDFGSFKDKELPEITLWEKYLVYATIFGLAKEVQKTMKIRLTEMSNIDSSYIMYNNRLFMYDYYFGNAIANSITKSYSRSMSTINAELAKSSSSSGSGFGGGFSSGGGFGGGGGGGHGF